MQVEIFYLPYTSKRIILLHLRQRYFDYCAFTASDGRNGKVGGGSFMKGLGGETAGGYHICSILCSVFVLLVFLLL